MVREMIFLVCIILLLIYFVWVTIFITNKYLIPKNNIREMEAKNQKYSLLSTISVEAVQKYIKDYIEEKINNYIMYKFISQRKNYIRDEDMETMIKDVTKLIYLEISELYIFYIKLIYSINDDDSLLKYINTLVKESAIELVSNYNSSMEL